MGHFEGVRLVVVQFAIANPDIVPLYVPVKEQLAVKEFTDRKEAGSEQEFKPILDSVPDVFCLDFAEDLACQEFELVDAFLKPVTHTARPHTKAQFVFASKPFVDSSSDFIVVKEGLMQDLDLLFNDAMWRVRAFRNPFYRDRKAVDGQFALSINLDARSALVDEEGEPLLRWQKDENGNRVGDKPMPITPKRFLRIENETICVKNAQ